MTDILATAPRITDIDSATIELPGTFLDAAARFASLPGTVVLTSDGDHDCARYHILGALPWLMLVAGPGEGGRLTIDGVTETFDGDPFVVLRRVLDRFRLPAAGDSTPLSAGLLGYLAYDLKDHLESLPRTCVDDQQLPTMLLFAPSALLVQDRQTQVTRLLVPRRGNVQTGSTVARIHEILAGRAPVNAAPPMAGRPVSDVTRPAYENAVQDIVDFITAGDVYQVNFTQRFRAPYTGDAFALFSQLLARNPAPFFAFVQGGDHQVVSTSPERFLRRIGDRVESRPIKGTRPRGDTPTTDHTLREELLASPKDDAELSMIVDLVRNDLGKVCQAGSVQVAEHRRLESYHNVHHLVSTMTGRLDAGFDSVDLIRAAFPGGSITGCPKIRAMEIIDALESHSRHVYCGTPSAPRPSPAAHSPGR